MDPPHARSINRARDLREAGLNRILDDPEIDRLERMTQEMEPVAPYFKYMEPDLVDPVLRTAETGAGALFSLRGDMYSDIYRRALATTDEGTRMHIEAAILESVQDLAAGETKLPGLPSGNVFYDPDTSDIVVDMELADVVLGNTMRLWRQSYPDAKNVHVPILAMDELGGVLKMMEGEDFAWSGQIRLRSKTIDDEVVESVIPYHGWETPMNSAVREKVQPVEVEAAIRNSSPEQLASPSWQVPRWEPTYQSTVVGTTLDPFNLARNVERVTDEDGVVRELPDIGVLVAADKRNKDFTRATVSEHSPETRELIYKYNRAATSDPNQSLGDMSFQKWTDEGWDTRIEFEGGTRDFKTESGHARAIVHNPQYAKAYKKAWDTLPTKENFDWEELERATARYSDGSVGDIRVLDYEVEFFNGETLRTSRASIYAKVTKIDGEEGYWLQIGTADLQAELMSTGVGQQMYSLAIEAARRLGLPLASDNSLSTNARRMYEAWREMGAEVEFVPYSQPDKFVVGLSQWLPGHLSGQYRHKGTSNLPVMKVRKLPDPDKMSWLWKAGGMTLGGTAAAHAETGLYENFVFTDEKGENPYVFSGQSPFKTNVPKTATTREKATAALEWDGWTEEQELVLGNISMGMASEGPETDELFFNTLEEAGFDHLLHVLDRDVSFFNERLRFDLEGEK